MNDFMYVKEVPWGHLGISLEEKVDTSEDIVTACKLDWETAYAQMYAEHLGEVAGYNAIYRTDTNRILGVVNKSYPKVVQNTSTFSMIEYMLGEELEFISAGQIEDGRKVFGVFKFNVINEKIIDDDIDSFIVIINDHLKPDGKVTILNTPVRIVCQNMLQDIINKNNYMCRIPCVDDIGINKDFALNVFNSAKNAINIANRAANKLLSQKITRDDIETVLDKLFPLSKDNTGEILDNKSNEKVYLLRDTFVTECMKADNLANYRGTAYQVYQAAIDFNQHYFTNVNHAYDLTKRMIKIPGVGTPTEPDKVKMLMPILNKLAA